LKPSRAFFPGKSQKNNPVGVNHSCDVFRYIGGLFIQVASLSV
jgi:hypothetical protein